MWRQLPQRREADSGIPVQSSNNAGKKLSYEQKEQRKNIIGLYKDGQDP